MEKTFFEMELRQALEKEQFLLHYQPQFDLTQGKSKGWKHSSDGIIPTGALSHR